MYEERPALVPGAVVWRRFEEVGGSGRVLPDGCMDLLVWDGELVIAGPDTGAHVVDALPGEGVTGLRFGPGVGPRFFGVPTHELRDQRVPLSAVWPGRAVRRLAERAAEHAAGQGGVLERAAAEKLHAAEDPDPTVRAVLARLRAGHGVAQTAAELGYSARQLHRKCTAAFGYGPKTLVRVERMQRALQLARSGTSLANVAALAGYADQAHLAREVRALAGVPLTELLRG